MPPQPLTNYRSFLSMLVQVSCEIAALKFETKRIMIASDALTSDVPTFPYTAEEDERFIDLRLLCPAFKLVAPIKAALALSGSCGQR
jgi:hypothetical protein